MRIYKNVSIDMPLHLRIAVFSILLICWVTLQWCPTMLTCPHCLWWTHFSLHYAAQFTVELIVAWWTHWLWGLSESRTSPTHWHRRLTASPLSPAFKELHFFTSPIHLWVLITDSFLSCCLSGVYVHFVGAKTLISLWIRLWYHSGLDFDITLD
jgi:hypothetical protein